MNLKKALELRKHKYIRKKRGKGGQWEYIYKELKGKSKKIDIKKINTGIRKAIKERPGRLTHGYTVTNSFWILKNGDIKQWNKKGLTETEKNLINVHSHSAENYKDYPKRKLQTFSGGDLWALRHSVRYGYGDTMVVINAHGLMDIFKGSEKIGRFTKKQCEYERLLTREIMDEIAKKYKIPVKGREDKIYRMVLRQIAKDTGSTYLENLKWKK